MLQSQNACVRARSLSRGRLLLMGLWQDWEETTLAKPHSPTKVPN